MKRAKHSLSHYRLTTMNMGQVYPIACLEVLPGDSFRHETAALIRVSPLVAPVMHPVHVQIHHWFVPNRLVWDNWEAFIVDINSALTIPTLTLDNTGSDNTWALADALGLGYTTVKTTRAVNALPFRAYNRIWNEYYRDQDIDAALNMITTNTGDTQAMYGVSNSRWEKDYFTTARPYPQDSTSTSVATLDLNLGIAPLFGIGVQNGNATAATETLRETPDQTRTNLSLNVDATNPVRIQMDALGYPAAYANLQELDGSASLDINEFRRAMAFQRIMEHRNRFGSRMTDYLRFLGITPSDARLQRPEYLGGGKATISFSEVLSTAASGSEPLGTLGGHGIAAVRSRAYRRFFEEHGYVLSFAIVRPRAIYMNNIPRHFLRRKPVDYWQKEMEMMGEQPVTNAELYFDSATPNDTFGYVQRYDEYRRQFSQVSGAFKRTPFFEWHFARLFASQPVLNSSFLAAVPSTRSYAVPGDPQLQVMAAHRIAARRLVSKFARS